MFKRKRDSHIATLDMSKTNLGNGTRHRCKKRAEKIKKTLKNVKNVINIKNTFKNVG